MPVGSLHSLLSGAIDYAGLFPPAALSMSQTVTNYAEYLASGDAWALGRFIVSAGQLDEFAAAFEALFPTGPPGSPWRLSALIGPDIAGDLAKVAAFHQRHRDAAVIDTLELKAANGNAIADAVERARGAFVTFHEISLEGDPQELLNAIARAGGRAKIRTGGLTPDAIPAPAAVARFLERAAAVGVGFKATAGLHHPLRAEQRLTDEPDSPRAVMHGFINVFLAASLAHTGWSAEQLVRVLEECSASAFQFGPDGSTWRQHHAANDMLRAARKQFLISFGSCSFEDPITELRALGWL